MKLKNKKTGIIGELHFEPDKEYHFTVATEDPADVRIYKKLADLYSDWQDYEEPKSWWYIDCNGEVFRGENADKEHTEEHKSIGNYYTSSKEAEKALEKLKAVKRLKDKGFRLSGWTIDDGLRISICTNTDEDDIYDEDKRRIKPDLDLLFGGEE